MNWLAKINLRIVLERLGPFKSSILLLLIISTSLYCGYRFGNFYHFFQKHTIEQQSQRLEGLYEKLSQQNSRINTINVELSVERLANEKAQAFIADIEQSHVELKKELAFYEKIMAPENEVDGIVLDSFTVSKTKSTNRFRYNAVVIQQQKSKRYAKGYVDMVIEGSLDNKPKKLLLSDISLSTQKDRSFSFKYFQRVENEFTLPENFKPEKVLVRVVLPKGKWQKFNQLNKNYRWSEIFDTKP